MGLALLGALAGFASGSAKRIEKEREENAALIKSRLQLAAINKKKREEEINARKQVYMNRYSSIQPYLFEGATEEQKLALISDDAITKDFIEKRRGGRSFDINEYLITNRAKIPDSFVSAKKTINDLSATPTPMTEEQMRGAFGSATGFLGANVGVSPGRAERIAAGLGGGTAAELLAYENMQPVEAEPLSGVARINVAMFPKDPKTLDEQITQQQSVVSAVADQFGDDSEETGAAITRLETLKQRKSVLDPDQQSFATMLDRAKAAVASADTDEKRKTAQARLDRLIAIGRDSKERKLPSVASMNNLLTDAATKAVVRTHGRLVNNGISLDTERDAEGNTFRTFRYVGGNNEEEALIQATARNAMKEVADTFMDSDGSPISPDLVTALSVNGVSFDPKTGRFNWTYTPPPVREGAPTVAAPPSRVSTSAAQTTPTAQTAPVVGGLGARPATPGGAVAPSTIQQRDGKFIVTVNNPDGSSQRFEFSNKQQADAFQQEANKFRGTR
jgi:hypothetical protein